MLIVHLRARELHHCAADIYARTHYAFGGGGESPGTIAIAIAVAVAVAQYAGYLRARVFPAGQTRESGFPARDALRPVFSAVGSGR